MSPQKEVIQPNSPHGWQKQNQLHRRSRHTNIQATSYINHAQQLHFSSRIQINNHWQIQFLYQHSCEKIRVYQTKIKQNPSQNHKTIQPKREGNRRWQCICRYPKRYVCPTPSRTHCKQTTQKMTGKSRPYPKQTSARDLDTFIENHPIHPSRQNIWCEIYWKRACWTPHIYPSRRLHHHLWLGRKTLRRNHFILGPPKLPGTYLYARIRQIIYLMLQPPNPYQTPRLAFPPHTSKIRSQNKIYKRTRHHLMTKRKRKEVHPTCKRKSSLPRIHCQHHSTNTSQHHRITTIKTYVNNNETITPNYRLRCHTRIIRPNLFMHPDATCLTHQLRVPQWTIGMQPRRRQLFHVKQHRIPTQKWRHNHHFTYHKKCHVISCQSQTWRPLHSCPRICIHLNNYRRIGTLAV